MYTDIIKILKFVLIVLKENDKTAFKGSKIYAIYHQYHRVVNAADLVLSHYLQISLESINSNTSFGSIEKKWLYFNNKNLWSYEEERHKLFLTFLVSESEMANPKYKNIFAHNFLSKGLNGRINEYSSVAKIGEDFWLTMYHFNLKTIASDDMFPIRDCDDLFTIVTFDLTTQEKRKKIFEQTKPQIDEIHLLLREFETIMAQYYTINDLFLNDERSDSWSLYKPFTQSQNEGE